MARVRGSSPRVRGTRIVCSTDRVPERFIPASAGNAAAQSLPRIARTVHPRVCGERYWLRRNSIYLVGSSPRVRGTRRTNTSRTKPARFIPACAGNAQASLLASVLKTVHPRVCGERFIAGREAVFVNGSSPRVRGTLGSKLPSAPVFRFIPACAGNASARCAVARSTSVHPRVCGERRDPDSPSTPSTGSSPRVRGTQVPLSSRAAEIRFIPACAGNAYRLAWPRSLHAVHPRVCGERADAFADDCAAPGSSPRVRGTPR